MTELTQDWLSGADARAMLGKSWETLRFKSTGWTPAFLMEYLVMACLARSIITVGIIKWAMPMILPLDRKSVV